ncbi:MAG: proline--tRNA ligase [Spirochaetales bacterium]|nr:proline--tRNA ligase [Spirochaetales bacterium]
MRMSQLFSRTLRPTGKDETASAEFLVRAGFIRQLAAGIYSYLPIAQRSINKIENIIREEMDRIGGQEITMPVVHPADTWKETNRYFEIDKELTKFNDRWGRDMVLAMTHEEIATTLIKSEIISYKQLPQTIYQIQTKWRDDARPRAGLIRVREFTMKDSYSAAANWEQLDKQYEEHFHAYFKMFNRCGLPVITVQSDLGMMGGKMAHEFMYLTSMGEDSLVTCDCGYTANSEVAVFKKEFLASQDEVELKEIETPGTESIEDLSKFLGVNSTDTVKAVFYIGTFQKGEDEFEKLVIAQIRGDLQVNETKIQNAIKAKALRPAAVEEIEGVGCVAGYGSAIGIKNAVVVADDSIQKNRNYIVGANKVNYHLTGARLGRDFTPDFITDIANAVEGAICSCCGKQLIFSRGVEVGNIFKLGTKYSESVGAVFNDIDGKEKPVIMGSYGIGVGRLLASIVEEHHDENGIIWPMSVSPYQVHLINLSKNTEKAEELYTSFIDEGIEVLFDDRTKERAGVKFKDADLFGIPLRIIVGDKSLETEEVEFKTRCGKINTTLKLEGITKFLKEKIDLMLHEEVLSVTGKL